MSATDQPAGFARLRELLDGDEDSLTAVEAHGLVCAMAVHPDPPPDWTGVASTTADGDRETALTAEHQPLAARLGAGDGICIPVRLDPYIEDEGNDLAAWCAGFMAGVMHTAEAWPDAESDQAERLLPFVLIAGLDDDPELDRLWEDESLVRQMAGSLPAMVEELFLSLRGVNDGD